MTLTPLPKFIARQCDCSLYPVSAPRDANAGEFSRIFTRGAMHLCEFAAVTAVGRKPPVMFRTEGARAGKALAVRLQAPSPAGCRHAADCGCNSGRAEAPGDVSHRRCARWQGHWPFVCRPLRPQAAAMRLIAVVTAVVIAVGRKPPAMFRTEGARAGKALAVRLQAPSPAGCRHAADCGCNSGCNSGWAEAPGDVSHRRCARWQGRWRFVCSALSPQAAAMRL